MANAPTSTLAEMCDLVVDCPHFTPKWTETGYIVIRNQNIRDGRLDLRNPSYTHRVDFERRIKRAKPRAGDIIFTREAPMGEVCMIPPGVECCVGQRQVLLRPKSSVSARYLFYALQCPYVRHQIFWNEGTGSTVSNVRIPVLKSLKIPRIAGAEASIAETLRALDDKIEMNRRMNETLEGIARTIFRDWFVDFGPTRAKQEAASGGAATGKANGAGREPYLAPDLWTLFPDRLDDDGKPEGWETQRVEDTLQLVYGKALRASDRIPGPIPVYGSGGITGYHNEALAEAPSIIVGRKGTVGSLYWEDEPFFPIDTVFYVKPKAPLSFCFYLLQSLGLETMNTDAAVPGLNRNNVYRLSAPNTQNELPSEFDKIVGTLRQKIRANISESRTLATTRDLLLPRLMSGEIRVAEAEKQAEEVLEGGGPQLEAGASP